MIGSFNSAAHPFHGASIRPGESRPAKPGDASPAASASKQPNRPEQLTADEKQQVAKLAARDAEVRAHEMAHLAAAGSLAMGGPNYVFQTGPDGKNYAIGGNVKIDTSAGRTPEETIRKAQQMRAAALAPTDPSPQDLKVAAAASRLESEAQQNESRSESSGSAPPEAGNAGGRPEEITHSRQLVAFAQDPAGQPAEEPHASASRAQRAAALYQQAP